MRVTARKVLSATQEQLVKDACAQRGVDVEIIENGPWILCKLSGHREDVATAWATILAGRHETLA